MRYATVADLAPLLRTATDPKVGAFVPVSIDQIEIAMADYWHPQTISTSGIGMRSVQVGGTQGTLLTGCYPALLESALQHLAAQRPDLQPETVR